MTDANERELLRRVVFELPITIVCVPALAFLSSRLLVTDSLTD